MILLTTLIGCAAPSAVKIDSTQGARGPVDKMLLIVRDEAGGFRAGKDPLKVLTREVKADLVRAGYAVSDPWDLGLSERQIRELIDEKNTSVVSAYGHLLAATVHPLRMGSTPAGFSMSFGDSDPRAQNFQRAELIPISCALVNTRSAREEASLREDKPAPGGDRGVPQEAGSAKGVEPLAGNIGAVCDKLLAELGVVRKVAKSEPSSPARPGTYRPGRDRPGRRHGSNPCAGAGHRSGYLREIGKCTSASLRPRFRALGRRSGSGAFAGHRQRSSKGKAGQA
ncbi:MAG: hypothetical protein ACREX3_08430 [Gammaproteobacteria bacterium]